MSEHNGKPANVYQTTYEALLKKYQGGNSRFKPQVKNWEEDLLDKIAQQTTAPRLIYVNKIDDCFFEMPRYEENISWATAWLMFFASIVPLVMVLVIIFIPVFNSNFERGFFYALVFLTFFSLTIWLFKLLIFYPRGMPVRFNRARQKVYVYEYKRSWNPWVRWRAEVKVFDWADIHGEMIRQIGRYDSGHRLSCAVCKPGTFEVIDRFMLSWTVGHPKMLRGLWSFCCHYMNDQPVPERPLIAKHPRSWCPRNNIHWPEAIDHESTTAP